MNTKEKSTFRVVSCTYDNASFVGAIGVQRFFSRFGTVNTLLLDYNIISDPIDWLGDSNYSGLLLF